jgi:predicted RNase H-like nuclease (RuvC/YqgF family)
MEKEQQTNTTIEQIKRMYVYKEHDFEGGNYDTLRQRSPPRKRPTTGQLREAMQTISERDQTIAGLQITVDERGRRLMELSTKCKELQRELDAQNEEEDPVDYAQHWKEAVREIKERDCTITNLRHDLQEREQEVDALLVQVNEQADTTEQITQQLLQSQTEGETAARRDSEMITLLRTRLQDTERWVKERDQHIEELEKGWAPCYHNSAIRATSRFLSRRSINASKRI